MLMIVFSHRHCKNDLFITETLQSGVNNSDFTIMRDVMYKYSKKAQDRFFEHYIEAFYFASFALSQESLDFVKQKPNIIEDPTKLDRLAQDLNDLKDQAVESLKHLRAN
jgi:hypothetical protein